MACDAASASASALVQLQVLGPVFTKLWRVPTGGGEHLRNQGCATCGPYVLAEGHDVRRDDPQWVLSSYQGDVAVGLGYAMAAIEEVGRRWLETKQS